MNPYVHAANYCFSHVTVCVFFLKIILIFNNIFVFIVLFVFREHGHAHCAHNIIITVLEIDNPNTLKYYKWRVHKIPRRNLPTLCSSRRTDAVNVGLQICKLVAPRRSFQSRLQILLCVSDFCVGLISICVYNIYRRFAPCTYERGSIGGANSKENIKRKTLSASVLLLFFFFVVILYYTHRLSRYNNTSTYSVLFNCRNNHEFIKYIIKILYEKNGRAANPLLPVGRSTTVIIFTIIRIINHILYYYIIVVVVVHQ